MAHNLNDKSLNDPNSKSTVTPHDSPDAQTSIIVLLSARAISSLGFAVSLLAIWLGWLLPASFTASDTSEINKPRLVSKHRRRSATPPTMTNTPIPARHNSAPADLAPILVPHPEETQFARRVSFADSPSPPPARRNTVSQPIKSTNSLATSISATPPHPSTSTSRSGMPPNGCLDDPNAQDSDSSLSKPSRLQKLKLGFNPKTNCQPLADKLSDGDSIISIESTASENIAKRCSAGFVAAWSTSRARSAGDDREQALASPSRSPFIRLLSPSTPATATPSSGRADIRSPKFLSSKAERRRSTPIPRTYPYGAPYFASPPVLLDKNTYPRYLKALPQFEDEVQFSSGRASEKEQEPMTGKVLLSRNHSHKVVSNRRSASEDWTVRPLD